MKTKEQLEACCPIGADITSYIHGYIEGYTDGQCESEPDLEAFRREAAKDAMCQLIGMGRDDGYKYSPEEVARYAIVYADELIRQLKEENK